MTSTSVAAIVLLTYCVVGLLTAVHYAWGTYRNAGRYINVKSSLMFGAFWPLYWLAMAVLFGVPLYESMRQKTR